jgi:hypothetical protein
LYDIFIQGGDSMKIKKVRRENNSYSFLSSPRKVRGIDKRDPQSVNVEMQASLESGIGVK